MRKPLQKLISISAVCFALTVSLNCLALADSQIRIQNKSKVKFDEVTVHFPSQMENYGMIKSGKASPYRKIKKAYGMALVEVVANGKKEIHAPVDYVGEPFLPDGRFTYVLKFKEGPGPFYGHGNLDLKLVRD